MNMYQVTGFNKYFNTNACVEASSQKAALIKVLKMARIKVNTVTKLTNSVNQRYLNNGFDPSTLIDFVVENLDSNNPIFSTGNWHVE